MVLLSQQFSTPDYMHLTNYFMLTVFVCVLVCMCPEYDHFNGMLNVYTQCN